MAIILLLKGDNRKRQASYDTVQAWFVLFSNPRTTLLNDWPGLATKDLPKKAFTTCHPSTRPTYGSERKIRLKLFSRRSQEEQS